VLLEQHRVAGQQRVERVRHDQQLEVSAEVVQHLRQPQYRREIHPQPDEIRQELRGVAEVDVEGGEKGCQAHAEDDHHGQEVEREQHQRSPGGQLRQEEMQDQIDGDGRQVPEEGGSHCRQRDQQAREGRVDEQLAGSGHRCRALGDRALDDSEDEQCRREMQEQNRVVLAAENGDEQVVNPG
jgi:hypothetical protein